MSDELTTIEIDLDDDTVAILERAFDRLYLEGFSEASLSIWKDKDVDLAKRLGETLINEFIYKAVQAVIDEG